MPTVGPLLGLTVTFKVSVAVAPVLSVTVSVKLEITVFPMQLATTSAVTVPPVLTTFEIVTPIDGLVLVTATASVPAA